MRLLIILKVALCFSLLSVVRQETLFAGEVNLPCTSASLERLPLLPRNISVHQMASHNKKGLNGDSSWVLYIVRSHIFLSRVAAGQLEY